MQRAYDVNSPNGSARRTQGDRVTCILRLYRKRNATPLPPIENAGPLEAVRDGIRSARDWLRENVLAPLGNGYTLEREIRFVLPMESLEDAQEIRSHVSYVRDGVYIDMPMLNATGYTNFRIVCRTHFDPIVVNGVPVDGDSGVKDFQELIQDYLYPGNRLGGSAADYELRWYNFLSPISADDPFGATEWVIQPKAGVVVRQSSQRPYSRVASLDFIGLRSNRDLAKAEDGFLAGLMSRGYLGAVLKLLNLDALATGLDSIFGAIDEFQGFLTDVDNVVAAAVDYVTAVRQFIQYSFAKVRGLINTVDEIIGRIEDGIELAQDIGALTEEQFELLQQTYPGMNVSAIDAGTGQHISTQESTQLGMLTVREARQLRDVLLAMTAQPQSFQAPLATQAQRTIAIKVPERRTIEQIASDAGVTVDALIELNGLRWPFVDARERPDILTARIEAERDRFTQLDLTRQSEGKLPLYTEQLALLETQLTAAAAEPTTRPGVLYAGDRIRIPQAAGTILPSIIGSDGNQILATDDPVSEETRLFGADFLMIDGRLVWDDDAGDVRVAEGLDNIRQVQDTYVQLPLGALRSAPDIGNFAKQDLSQFQGPGQTHMLAFSYSKTLSQDPRIRRIAQMRAVTTAGATHLLYNATLINGEDLTQLRAPVEV